MKEDLSTLARRTHLTDLLKEQKSILVKDAAAYFGVSDMTIRRDLHVLEGQGVVTLFHGGAAIRLTDTHVFSFDDRTDRMFTEKQMVARKACEYLKQNTIIYLDSSTTVLQMVRSFPNFPITVVTTSLKAASILSAFPNVRLYIAPGRYDPVFDGSADYSTIEYIDRFRFDQAYLGAGYLSAEDGFTTLHEYESLLKSHILSSAKESFFLLDHTKFGYCGSFRITEAEGAGTIITDAALSTEQKNRFAQKGIHLVLADGSRRTI